MRKINFSDTVTFTGFWARGMSFLFSIICVTHLFACPIEFTEKIIELSTKSETDSLVQNSKEESVKIYISGNIYIYNIQEIKGNLEIVRRQNPVKQAKKIASTVSRKPKETKSVRTKAKANYAAKVEIKKLPVSDTTFSRIRGCVSTVLPANRHQKFAALTSHYQVYYIHSTKGTVISGYVMPFDNQIYSSQARIRPPPFTVS